MGSERKSRHSLRFTSDVLTRLVASLPRTLLREQWLDSFRSDHSKLPSEIDVSRYSDWREFACDYLIVNLASKLDCLDLTVDRKAVALNKFLASEETCRLVNRRFAKLDSRRFKLSARLPSILHAARINIERILGPFDWNEAEGLMGFGPGASLGIPRKRSHSVYKFGHRRPTVTGECAALGEALFSAYPQWRKAIVPDFPEGSPDYDIVPGNSITTVPKSSKTDRVIAIEPLLNMFVQKGVGGMIRRRLKRVGIDLDSQKRNQDLAKLGSLSKTLATIDLSSASDTISLGLVEWLVPADWVLAMKICRSPIGTLPSGERIRYQKISSMGNGFTFELESMIFYALTRAVAESMDESVRDIAVFGDDIIAPTCCVPLLCNVFRFCGFTMNPLKTHASGCFRESCGKHYFEGRDVSPFYVKVDVESDQRKLWLANSIRRWASRLGGGLFCDALVHDVWLHTLRSLPHAIRRLSVPEGNGDGGVVRDFDEARPRRHRFFDAFVTTHLVRSFTGPLPDEQPALCLSLMKLERSAAFLRGSQYGGKTVGSIDALGLRPEEIEIGRIPARFKDRISHLVVQRWEGLGPWIQVA